MTGTINQAVYDIWSRENGTANIVRFAKGIQLVWGIIVTSIEKQTYKNFTLTYPNAFNWKTPVTVMNMYGYVQAYPSSGVFVWPVSQAYDHCDFRVVNNNTNALNNMPVYFITVGWWKNPFT